MINHPTGALIAHTGHFFRKVSHSECDIPSEMLWTDGSYYLLIRVTEQLL
jgi:hypothetical protein